MQLMHGIVSFGTRWGHGQGGSGKVVSRSGRIQPNSGSVTTVLGWKRYVRQDLLVKVIGMDVPHDAALFEEMPIQYPHRLYAGLMLWVVCFVLQVRSVSPCFSAVFRTLSL